MYKYYSLERPISIGTYPKNKDNKMIAFENYENDNQCVKKEICDSNVSIINNIFSAWGYLLFEKPLTDKEISDYELADAGLVKKETKISELPLDLQEDLRTEINQFYNVEMTDSKPYRMSREAFSSFYNSFTLNDFNKMIPIISKKYALVSEKEKTPIEQFLDSGAKCESSLDAMKALDIIENGESIEDEMERE